MFAANAGNIEAAAACVEATIERFGGLDILVNNAATNPYYGATLDVDPSPFDKTFEVNLRGPLFWCQAAHRRAFAEKPGVIINIASVGGLRAEFGLGVYNLTKAALIHLTRQLAGEIGPTRVVGIAPGLVKTDFAVYLVDNFGDELAKALPAASGSASRRTSPTWRVFLASDLASWITGETYVIDGGAGREQRRLDRSAERRCRACPRRSGAANSANAASVMAPDDEVGAREGSSRTRADLRRGRRMRRRRCRATGRRC